MRRTAGHLFVLVVTAVGLGGCRSGAPRTPPVKVCKNRAPPAPVGPGIGSRGRFTLEAHDPEGRWVVLCQAREDTNCDGQVAVWPVRHHGGFYGDRMDPYLIFGEGGGTRLDAVLDAERKGDYLAALRGGDLVLVHTRGEKPRFEVLARAAADDQAPGLGHRAAEFDFQGRRLLYLRTGPPDAGRDRVVVRTLDGGAERAFSVGEAALWRAGFYPGTGGAWVIALVVDNPQGKHPWPRQRTSLSRRGCRGAVMGYTLAGWSGPRPRRILVDMASAGHPRPTMETVAVVAGELVIRGSDGSLRARDRVATREIAGGACQPLILGTTVTPPRLALVCDKGPDQGKLRFYPPAPEGEPAPGVEDIQPAVRSNFCFGPQSGRDCSPHELWLFKLKAAAGKEAPRPPAPPAHFESNCSHGQHAVGIQHPRPGFTGDLVVLNRETGQRAVVLDHVDEAHCIAANEAYLFIWTHHVRPGAEERWMTLRLDMASLKATGAFRWRPIAVDRRGWGLNYNDRGQAPLKWEAPHFPAPELLPRRDSPARAPAPPAPPE